MVEVVEVRVAEAPVVAERLVEPMVAAREAGTVVAPVAVAMVEKRAARVVALTAAAMAETMVA